LGNRLAAGHDSVSFADHFDLKIAVAEVLEFHGATITECDLFGAVARDRDGSALGLVIMLPPENIAQLLALFGSEFLEFGLGRLVSVGTPNELGLHFEVGC